MHYYKIRGRPDDPRNIACMEQKRSLEELVQVNKLSKSSRSNPRAGRSAAPVLMQQPRRLIVEPFVVKKITAGKSETIQDRIKTEIYKKVVPNVLERPVSREEKTMKLIKEILNDSFVTKLEIEQNDADVIKTIEETQKEINLAANQLMEINKLLEAKKSATSVGDAPEKERKRQGVTLRKLIKYNSRKGWEWMSSQYLEAMNDDK